MEVGKKKKVFYPFVFQFKSESFFPLMVTLFKEKYRNIAAKI